MSRLQNIIKKVIGQKFVYKFVSFTEILKMDAASVESGRVGGEDGEDGSGGGRDGRDEYLRSGLYSSFAVSSPRRTVKVEPRSDLHEEVSSSVIRFRTDRGHSSQPCTPPPPSVEMLYVQERSSPCSPPSPRSPDHSAQPLNLSSGRQRQRLRTPEGRSPAKSRKPECLEISGSSHLLLAGSDLVSIALKSPALPSGSLTPAFFTAQVQTLVQMQVGFFFHSGEGEEMTERDESGEGGRLSFQTGRRWKEVREGGGF